MRARGNLTIREKRWTQLLEFYLSFGLLCFCMKNLDLLFKGKHK